MFIGEVDFSDLYNEGISKELDGGAWTFGYIMTIFLYLTFIFVIVIILTNLLNGLAVSDVGELKGKAEIDSAMVRMETISDMLHVLKILHK